MISKIHAILKNYWGFDSFRTLQEEIITSVIEGHDTLAVLPTGGGKSICFQVPAMLNDGICLVITPLIALMKDQVESLKKRGIPSLSIYSGMGYAEVAKTLRNAANGNFKFLYVSPERLESKLFLEFLPALPITLVAVDEAHCISQWGYDFRPPYLRIASIREQLESIPVIALTASATKEIQEDICTKLFFRKGYRAFQKSFERPNLSYSAFNAPSKEIKLLEILKNVKGSGIVYCKSRKRTKQICDLLQANKITSDYYHAGLSNEDRSQKQERWVNGEIRIITSTNAFGMGIDKSTVRTVVHFDVPDNLESYYQEAGRAGRDEKKAYAVLLFNEAELKNLREQAAIRFPSPEKVKNVYQSIANYLQLPTGAGEGIYYDFELIDFIEKFKLELFAVIYALKILEQEDILVFSENVFLPSTVVFTAGRADLEVSEKTHPELDPLVKGLLRLYQGIVDAPSSVYEKQLAVFIREDHNTVKAKLRKLHELNIIDYRPQNEKPQLLFLKNRCRTEDLVINTKNMTVRKNAFLKRMEAMLSYVKTGMCRSKLIGNYFNDYQLKPCGICDNCIKEKEISLSSEEFNNISGTITTIVQSSPASAKQLLDRFNTSMAHKVWKVLNFLQAENKISIDRVGNFTWMKDV